MKASVSRFLVLIIVLLWSVSALAQQPSQWNWRIAPYLWAANLDGSTITGPLTSDVDFGFGDILENLDSAIIVAAGARKGHHDFNLDIVYMRLKPDPVSLPFPPNASLGTKVSLGAYEPSYVYWLDESGEGLGLVGGLRYVDMSVTLSPTHLPPRKATQDWVDVFGGVRFSNRLSPKWDFGFYGTVGGGGSDTPWTLQALFARRFANDDRLGIGFRYWSIDYDDGQPGTPGYFNFDVDIFGVVVGFEFN